MLNKVLLSILLFITAQNGFGEYRVYQYYVINKNNADSQGYIRASTLDPVSFLAYHGGNTLIDIDLLRTWMCKGHTAYKTYCDSPLKSVQQGMPNESHQ